MNHQKYSNILHQMTSSTQLFKQPQTALHTVGMLQTHLPIHNIKYTHILF